MLEIKDLHVTVDNKEILKGISLSIKPGEKVALMGPNGSGKSTLCNAIMGHPRYVVTSGSVVLDGETILKINPELRARKGLFMSFQNPQEISGVTVSQFLKLAYDAVVEKINVLSFQKILEKNLDRLHMSHTFSERYLNEGFSGGEKKKSEILQMLTLEPKYAILDETDSGLDVDALNIISEGINSLKNTGFLIITHYNRILEKVKPDRVLILQNGKITKEGNASLALETENEGFRIINK